MPRQNSEIDLDVQNLLAYFSAVSAGNVLARISEALAKAPTVTVTGGGDALKNAILAAVPDDVIEVQDNGTYNPITLPAAPSLVIRAGKGYAPRLSGTNCIQINNGATGHIVSGFGFVTYTTGDNNAMGAGITFTNQGSKCSNLIFHNLSFEEVTSGSAVMLSYHRSVGGDNYANPPQPSEMSDGIAFVSCRAYKACKDGTEGAAFALRAFKNPFFYDCWVDGAALSSRGYQFQNCTGIWVEKSRAENFTVNGEGIKIDNIGTPVAVRNTGWIYDCDCHKCVEGIDCDDYCDVVVMGNRCTDCSTVGIGIDGGAAPGNAQVLAVSNACTRCGSGIKAEAGSVCELFSNSCWGNTINFDILNGYTLPGSNVTAARSAMAPLWKGVDDLAERVGYTPTTPANWSPVPTQVKGALDTLAAAGIGGTGLMKFTPIGGLAVYMKNSTVATILKGRIVKADSANDDSIVEVSAAGDIDPIGIVYEDIAAGAWGWVVVAGIVDVYVDNVGAVSREWWVGTSTVNAGQGTASVLPSPPSVNSHFQEVGHTIRAITGPGLVRIVTHQL